MSQNVSQKRKRKGCWGGALVSTSWLIASAAYKKTGRAVCQSQSLRLPEKSSFLQTKICTLIFSPTLVSTATSSITRSTPLCSQNEQQLLSNSPDGFRQKMPPHRMHHPHHSFIPISATSRSTEVRKSEGHFSLSERKKDAF